MSKPLYSIECRCHFLGCITFNITDDGEGDAFRCVHFTTCFGIGFNMLSKRSTAYLPMSLSEFVGMLEWFCESEFVGICIVIVYISF